MAFVMLKDKNVVAIQCSDTKDEQYALFCDGKGLYHGNDKDGFILLAVLENINPIDRFIKLYYHFPYICVTERYGSRAIVVNIVNRDVLNNPNAATVMISLNHTDACPTPYIDYDADISGKQRMSHICQKPDKSGFLSHPSVPANPNDRTLHYNENEK